MTSERRFQTGLALGALMAISGTVGLAQGPSTGSMGGSVADEKGKAIANAVVAVSILPAGQPVIPFMTTTRTGPDGRFLAVGLPPGTYQVCGQVEGSTLVDICRWGTPAATAVVQAGGTATVQPITLKQGHKVHIRVIDPQNLLQTNEGATKGAHLLIGVWTSKGIFVPAPVSGKDAAGRDQQLYVPEDMDLQLSVFSAFFAMGDSLGTALAKNQTGASTGSVPFRAAATEGPKEFVFRVIGKN